MSRIVDVSIIPFEFAVEGLGLGEHAAMGVSNVQCKPDGRIKIMRYGVEIRCDDGATGRYVTHWVGTEGSLGQTLMLAPHLLGRDPERREEIYDAFKRELRAYDHMGHGPLDIALWDLVGHKYNMSIATMLGSYRERLPTYASTHHGQEDEYGLSSPERFAEYAVECREKGFVGFKIHGWHDGNRKREAANILAVRKAVGRDMEIMVDMGSDLRTFADALFVGRACDEAECFWYEDPYRDGSVSAFSHKMLRDRLKTPLLITEHVRGPEQKASFLVNGGCDYIHLDPEYDMGITGAMKIAHMAEALGVDVQVHACGPAHRLCIAAIRNTHFYEMALIGPGMPNLIPPVYTCGYSDQPDAIDQHGTVPVPTGPGLGVNYDWEFVLRHKLASHQFKI